MLPFHFIYQKDVAVGEKNPPTSSNYTMERVSYFISSVLKEAQHFTFSPLLPVNCMPVFHFLSLQSFLAAIPNVKKVLSFQIYQHKYGFQLLDAIYNPCFVISKYKNKNRSGSRWVVFSLLGDP